MRAERRLKEAATTFNYTKRVSPEEFDRLIKLIQIAAWDKGYLDLYDWEAGYSDTFPVNPFGDA